MTIYMHSYKLNWTKVCGDYKKEMQTCPRCGNDVAYELCYESDGVGIANVILFAIKKYYAYKCPICPNFELVPSELAKAILKG